MPTMVITQEAVDVIRAARDLSKPFHSTGRPRDDGMCEVDLDLMTFVRLKRQRRPGESDSDLVIRVVNETMPRVAPGDGMFEGNARANKRPR